jgi:hypothetical protein
VTAEQALAVPRSTSWQDWPNRLCVPWMRA